MREALQGASRKVAFIGTGIMGAPMARHLLEAGFDVTVFNRTLEKALPLAECGARVASDVANAVTDADVVITMLGHPEDVEEVYLGDRGVIACAPAGAVLIDMTTSSPELARSIRDAARGKGQLAFDAPVTGGQAGAQAASLTIFCGATEDELAGVRDVLDVLGSKVVVLGEAGNGQLAKLTNQVALAGALLGMVEGLTFAREVGLDTSVMLDAMLAGTSSSEMMRKLGPKVLAGDYTPGFKVEHYLKDLNLALTAAQDRDVFLPGAEAAARFYSMLDAIGGSQMGTQALHLVYADEAACAEAGLDWTLAGLDDEEPSGTAQPATADGRGEE